MIPEKIKFGDYIFNINPETLRVSDGRRVSEYGSLQNMGDRVFDAGQKCRRVTGSGVFCGERAMVDYMRLRYQMKMGMQRLYLPGHSPFNAIMTSLVVTSQPGPDRLEYTFEFIQTEANEEYGYPDYSSHTVSEGENLFSIASLYSLSYEHLINNNPSITDPFNLTVGMRIKL